jgi:hypothetical protein
LLAALRPPSKGGAAPAKIEAFDLTIQVRYVTVKEGGSEQPNDIQMRYRYLAPGFVHTLLLNGGVERMRGPRGDFLVDPKKGDVVSLAGREFANDRLELTRTLSMARNYVTLADPAAMRIARLTAMDGPPAALRAPPALPDETIQPGPFEKAAGMQWVEVVSPDFAVVAAVDSKTAPMFRAQIGLDSATHLPRLVVIFQDEGGTIVAETAVLVDLTASKYEPMDGLFVPKFFAVHDPLLPSSPFAFQRKPRTQVVVKQGTLRAKLSGKDFQPPSK